MIEHVILPGTEGAMLRKELASAFASLGLRVSMPDPARLHDASYPLQLEELLDGRPALFFSINGSGLASLRKTRELLARANCHASIWFVDNPWNILSGLRDPDWKTLPLFVTDDSFTESLHANGAERVHHLPLAASFEHFTPNPVRDAAYPPPRHLAPLVFVGRSAFPGKEAFFAGLSLPDDLLAQSQAMLLRAERPDLRWWENRLGSRQKYYWPGREARLPAFGAEENNRQWRALCLAAAAAAGRDCNVSKGMPGPGLDVFGDDGWKSCLPPGIRLRPPVDYYARLPGIYAKAEYSLCLTSLQLPQGLNQRHFDVWAAGGVCLSDATPGLALFPEELTRPITFTNPQNLRTIMENIEKNGLRPSLVHDWQTCLREKHCYVQRAQSIMEAVA